MLNLCVSFLVLLIEAFVKNAVRFSLYVWTAMFLISFCSLCVRSLKSIEIGNDVGNVIIWSWEVISVPSQRNRLRTSNVVLLVLSAVFIGLLDIVDLHRRWVYYFNFGIFRRSYWVARRSLPPRRLQWCDVRLTILVHGIFVTIPAQKLFDLAKRCSVINWRDESWFMTTNITTVSVFG